MGYARHAMNALAGLSPGRTLSAEPNRSTNTEAATVDQAHQLPEQDPDQAVQSASPNQAPADLDDLASYSTRIRVIVGLSLLSWLLVAVGILWLIRSF